MEAISPNVTITSDNSHLARGRKRMAEIATEDAAARVALEAEIVGSFGRAPSVLEAATIELLVATLIKGRRLRALGRSDLQERQLAERLLGRLGLSAPSEPIEREIA